MTYIDDMAIAAKARLHNFINRSAGQHIRAMRKTAPLNISRDDWYAITQESETAYQLHDAYVNGTGNDPLDEQASYDEAAATAQVEYDQGVRS